MTEQAIAPGASLGFFGGGQLGRLSAMAARNMGYDVVILDPDPQCSAAAVADACITASFDDAQAAAAMAQQVAVVTYEIEKIGADAADAVAPHAPLRPGPHVLRMVQDRATQKGWLVEHHFPVASYQPVNSAADVAATLHAWGAKGRLKTRRGGYDGRGQITLTQPSEAAAAWQQMGGAPCVLERELTLAAELSVLVARRPQGEVAVYPPAQNWHEHGVLRCSTLPAQLPAQVLQNAQDMARRLAETLMLEGLLVAEFFLTTEGILYINELAPRPHNSYHAADTACATSQFEQHVRAVCNLPLGRTDIVRPTALANILGDLWNGDAPNFCAALDDPAVRLYLYGKTPRPGRKMGHLLATGPHSAAALATVQAAWQRLRPSPAL